MRYEERPAPPGFEDSVSRLWYLEAPRERRFEKILPLPFVHVIVNLSEPYALYDRAGAPTPVDDAFVSGIQSSYLVIESPPVIRHVGVELLPGGLGAVTDAAASDVAHRVQDARLVIDGIDRLVRALGAGPDADAALSELSSFIAARAPQSVDGVVQRALAMLHANTDRLIGDIADELGVSHRTLIARFRAATGLTPKAYAQMYRFHRLIDAVQAIDGDPDWTMLTGASGYYDQPHVIRAFRRFCGWTPTEYRRRVAEFGPDAAHFVPLDEVPVG